MTMQEAIASRHSVRRYTDKPLAGAVLAALKAEIERSRAESGLNIQLMTDDPGAFKGFFASYGLLRGVRNYIALVGKNEPGLEEKCGWYGEHLVLFAQMLGLNTCWIGGTYSRKKLSIGIAGDEKLVCVIAIGYGADQGRPHRSKRLESLCTVHGDMPDWFRRGMEAAALAPTAINQQKFHFTLSGSSVSARAGAGPYSKVDLGIVKYHFETAAGRENFSWS